MPTRMSKELQVGLSERMTPSTACLDAPYITLVPGACQDAIQRLIMLIISIQAAADEPMDPKSTIALTRSGGEDDPLDLGFCLR